MQVKDNIFKYNKKLLIYTWDTQDALGGYIFYIFPSFTKLISLLYYFGGLLVVGFGKIVVWVKWAIWFEWVEFDKVFFHLLKLFSL